MAFKPRNQGKDYKALQTILVNSRLGTDNKALYDVIKTLVDGAGEFQDGLSKSFNKDSDKIALSSQVSGLLSATNGGVESNVYFPDVIPINNISNISAFNTRFLATSKVVQLSGKLSIDTIGFGLAEFDLKLPISSAFTLEEQLQGLINGIGTAETFSGIGIVNLVTANAKFRFIAPSGDTFDTRFIIIYERAKV